jgi:hypothetical protein
MKRCGEVGWCVIVTEASLVFMNEVKFIHDTAGSDLDEYYQML